MSTGCKVNALMSGFLSHMQINIKVVEKIKITRKIIRKVTLKVSKRYQTYLFKCAFLPIVLYGYTLSMMTFTHPLFLIMFQTNVFNPRTRNSPTDHLLGRMVDSTTTRRISDTYLYSECVGVDTVAQTG